MNLRENETSLQDYEKKEKSLIRGVNNSIAYVIKDIRPYVSHVLKEKVGMTVLGSMKGREDEPETIFDNLAGEYICQVFNDATRKFGIPYRIYSEHLIDPITTGSRGPYYPIALDPVDQSAQHEAEIDEFYTPAWTVLSIYDLNGDPLGAGAINYGNQKAYVNREGKNYFHDPNDLKFKNDILFPYDQIGIKSARYKKIVLAAYRDKAKYDLAFIDNFKKLIEDMKLYYSQIENYEGQIISAGGNFIYVPLALGKTHEYIAVIEPLEECFAGMPFLLSAGGEIRLVSLDRKSYQNLWRFDPDLVKRRAVLLLASRWPELMDETMAYYSLGKPLMERVKMGIGNKLKPKPPEDIYLLKSA